MESYADSATSLSAELPPAPSTEPEPEPQPQSMADEDREPPSPPSSDDEETPPKKAEPPPQTKACHQTFLSVLAIFLSLVIFRSRRRKRNQRRVT